MFLPPGADPEIFFIAHHKRNNSTIDDVEKWPVWRIWDVAEYLQSIDDADYQQYLNNKPKK